MREFCSAASSDNPIKYTDPTGMWINNGDGTYTAEAGDTLWGLYGADWREKSGYEGDPTKLQVGQVVGFKNPSYSTNNDVGTNNKNTNVVQEAKIYGINPRVALLLGIGIEAYLLVINNEGYLVLGIQGGVGVEVGVGAAGANSLVKTVVNSLVPGKIDIPGIAANYLANSNTTFPIQTSTWEAKSSMFIFGLSTDLNTGKINGLEFGSFGGGVYWGRRGVIKLW